MAKSGIIQEFHAFVVCLHVLLDALEFRLNRINPALFLCFSKSALRAASYQSERSSLATIPAPPKISTKINTHSYSEMRTNEILVVMIIATIIITTDAIVNSLDKKLPPEPNIHKIPIINGTIITPFPK